MKTKIVSIFLLFSLLIPGGATFVWLRHRRATIRREVKHRLIASVNRNELELLKFSEEQLQSELKWKHSKEFQYQNYMYDIVERTRVGDTTYFWCWWDYEETVLHKQLDIMLAKALGQDPQNNERQMVYFQFFKSLFHPQLQEEYALIPSSELHHATAYLFSSIQADLPPPIPPPKISV